MKRHDRTSHELRAAKIRAAEFIDKARAESVAKLRRGGLILFAAAILALGYLLFRAPVNETIDLGLTKTSDWLNYHLEHQSNIYAGQRAAMENQQ